MFGSRNDHLAIALLTVEAVRQDISPVLVWTGPGAGEGNQFSIERGAKPVDHTESTFSFREWLRRECAWLGVDDFPPADFRRDVVTG